MSGGCFLCWLLRTHFFSSSAYVYAHNEKLMHLTQMLITHTSKVLTKNKDQRQQTPTRTQHHNPHPKSEGRENIMTTFKSPTTLTPRISPPSSFPITRSPDFLPRLAYTYSVSCLQPPASIASTRPSSCPITRSPGFLHILIRSLHVACCELISTYAASAPPAMELFVFPLD